MKQTNNAIKFLMAQYRAIFKNANIAMVAAMAAASLAAGSANAADGLTGELQATANAAQDIVVASGKHDLDATSNKFAKTLTISKGASATIKSGGVTSLGDVNLNSGSLTVSGTTAGLFLGAIKEVDSTPRQHYEYDLTATNSSTITLDQANIGVANFDIASSTISLKSGGTGGTNLTAYGEGTYQNDAQPKNYIYNAIGKLTDVTANLVGGTNITAIGHLDVKGSSKEKSEINLKGTDANSSTDYQQTLAYLGGSKKLTIDNTTINASGTAATGSKGAALVSPDLKITNSKIVVAGEHDILTLGGFGDRKSAGGATGLTADNYKAGSATIANSTITVSGTLNLGHGEHTKSSFNLTGNTIQNKGVINAYGDVSVDKVAGLFDSGNGATGKLNLSGSSFVVTGANESIDISKANIKADAKSELVVENGSIKIDKDFVSKVGNVNAGTIVISGVESGSAGSSNGAPSGSSSLKVGGGAHITAFNKLEGSKARSILMLDPATSKEASLTLGDSAGSKGELKNIERVQIGNANTAGNSEFDVYGTWDFKNAGLYVAKGATANIHEGASITDVERLKIESGSTTKINGTATIKRLFGKNGGGTLDVNGTLNVAGDGNKTDASTKPGEYINDVYLTQATLNINAGGTVALEQDAWDDVLNLTAGDDKVITAATANNSTANTSNEGAWVASKVSLNAGGTLRVDLSGYKVANKATVESIATALAGQGYKGLVDLGKISITSLESASGPVNIADVPNVKTDATKKLEVNVGSGTLNGSYSIGSANVEGGTLTTAQNSTLEFSNAKGGQFATNVSATGGADKSVGVTLAKGSALVLNGNGSLGNIQNSGNDTTVVLGGNNGTQTVGDVNVAKFNMVGGNVTTGDVTTATLNIAGGAINAAGKNITVSSDASEAKIFGDLEAASLSLSGGATIAGGADVKLDTLNLSGGKTLNVGRDGEDGSTATVFTDKLVMGASSKIFIDPSYKIAATVLGTKTLTDGTSKPGVNVAAGDIFVGQNAAFGIGFDQAEFNSVMANYLVDGKFTDPAENKGGYANALVIGDSLAIASGKGVTVDHNLTDDKVASGTGVTANTVSLGANAALIITDGAFGKNPDGSKTGPAIKINDNDGKVTAAAGSSVVLVGDFTAADKNLTIFGDNQNGVDVTGTANVVAAGGLLVGTLGTNGSIASLALDPDAEKAIRSEVSAPVGQLFVDFANGKFDGATGAGYDFVVDAISYKQFKAVDAAAHAATYAGAQQAAVVSVTTMADAMFGRVGAVGVEAASIAATGSQANGGVWLTPMYKSMDADGFNAEGVSYGSDVDAAGVAFGADTVNGNMRFGAVFNIGSGDAEGKGQGNGLKDEFDYYGFGIYSAMGFGNLALVGDASLTVISHDVEGLGLRGKADTTAVTMGLTGQYTVSTPMVDVTPHLGARFIRLNTDSYDLVGADGAIATTDFDVQNVFSVPLGVTLSKGFTTGGWTLAPSADLTITFNGGDTEAKSSTTFTGIKAINMNTEVLDEVTYGLTLGLGAQYGAFGTSFGINYTGSENTDSFGVNAQARYMF